MQLTGFHCFRQQHHLGFRAFELGQVVALDALELGPDQPLLGPFAIRSVSDVANNCLELMCVDVFRQLAIVYLDHLDKRLKSLRVVLLR